jgi:hypothetical protein
MYVQSSCLFAGLGFLWSYPSSASTHLLDQQLYVCLNIAFKCIFKFMHLLLPSESQSFIWLYAPSLSLTSLHHHHQVHSEFISSTPRIEALYTMLMDLDIYTLIYRWEFELNTWVLKSVECKVVPIIFRCTRRIPWCSYTGNSNDVVINSWLLLPIAIPIYFVTCPNWI